jgi:protein-S-isoprenylcysteine O-methyltransferase Ste14
MVKNLILGIIMIVVALALLFYPGVSEWFLPNTINIILGVIPLLVGFFGVILFIMGWDEISAPKFEAPVTERRGRKRK